MEDIVKNLKLTVDDLAYRFELDKNLENQKIDLLSI
jgi:hypothetical protein